MDDLRLILLVIGVALIAGIYLWETGRRRGRGRARRPAPDPRDPPLGPLEDEPAVTGDDPLERLRDERAARNARALTGLESYDIDADLEPPRAGAPAPEPAPEQLRLEGLDAPRARAGATAATAADDVLVVAVTVMAPQGQRFAGPAIRVALEEEGLRFGERGLYHRDDAAGSRPAFSALNVVEPGVLDPETLAATSTPGLALVMEVPGPADPGAAFEDMLATGRRLAERLGGRLCDERRATLTGQRVNHLRERIAEFGRRRLLRG